MYEEEIRKANTPEALLQVIRSVVEECEGLPNVWPGGLGGGLGEDAYAIQQRAIDIRAENLSLDLPPVPSTKSRVDMQNWCITASKCFHKKGCGKALDAPGKKEAGGKTAELSKEALALAALTDHPDWTDEQIADAADCCRESLYRMKKFMAAKALLKEGKHDVARGSKSKEGEVEAWKPGEGPDDGGSLDAQYK